MRPCVLAYWRCASRVRARRLRHFRKYDGDSGAAAAAVAQDNQIGKTTNRAVRVLAVLSRASERANEFIDLLAVRNTGGRARASATRNDDMYSWRAADGGGGGGGDVVEWQRRCARRRASTSIPRYRHIIGIGDGDSQRSG